MWSPIFVKIHCLYYMGKTFQFMENEYGIKLTSHKIILKDLSDLCLKRLKLEKKDYVKPKPRCQMLPLGLEKNLVAKTDTDGQGGEYGEGHPVSKLSGKDYSGPEEEEDAVMDVGATWIAASGGHTFSAPPVQHLRL
ncbi:hypothetical protein MG293_003935 [Ovis ammon polii]|uniref:Uncharacterized protein n=1 Tax=Ovis ammon polii TaxID=230172 RepID=A0AAD4UNN9_OVIAM|nr:hypothetical protein MG293_003935 [Ovis ammon polii]